MYECDNLSTERLQIHLGGGGGGQRTLAMYGKVSFILLIYVVLKHFRSAGNVANCSGYGC